MEDLTLEPTGPDVFDVLLIVAAIILVGHGLLTGG